MNHEKRLTSFWCGFVLAALAATVGTSRSLGQDSFSEHAPQVSGRIDFDFATGSAATVEIDLVPELIGLGELMVTGVVDALTEALADDPQASHKLQLTEERMAALRSAVSSTRGVIEEVRVRIYKSDDDATGMQMVRHYTAKLEKDGWDNVATVRENGEQVKVAVLRQSDSIRGVFAIVTNQREVVMLNLSCELSPEKVQTLVSTALRIGMELGLDEVVQDVLEELSEEVTQELR